MHKTIEWSNQTALIEIKEKFRYIKLYLTTKKTLK